MRHDENAAAQSYARSLGASARTRIAVIGRFSPGSRQPHDGAGTSFRASAYMGRRRYYFKR